MNLGQLFIQKTKDKAAFTSVTFFNVCVILSREAPMVDYCSIRNIPTIGRKGENAWYVGTMVVAWVKRKKKNRLGVAALRGGKRVKVRARASYQKTIQTHLEV